MDDDGPVIKGTSAAQISEWCKRGVEVGAAFCVIKSDTFSYEYYPVYVMPDEDVKHIANVKQDFTKLMEVYDLSKPLEPQLEEHRAMNMG
jgi:hypothetical protein